MTNDLAQFLRDRLDEDEQTARATEWCAGTKTFNGWDAHRVDDDEWEVRSRGAQIVRDVGPEFAAHIARHDPARVLAEVEAKRRIVECHESWVAGNGDTICGRCGREHIDGRPGGHFPCQTLRLLALPYADHPDYRQEWSL
jgi:hypothetical protein